MTFHSHGKLKTTGILCGNVEFNRGNFMLTVGIVLDKSTGYNLINAVFTVNIKLSENGENDLFPLEK